MGVFVFLLYGLYPWTELTCGGWNANGSHAVNGTNGTSRSHWLPACWPEPKVEDQFFKSGTRGRAEGGYKSIHGGRAGGRSRAHTGYRVRFVGF
jgi:hypothetical protein